MPQFGYLTHTDDSHDSTVCTPVHEIVTGEKGAYYALRLIELLLSL